VTEAAEAASAEHARGPNEQVRALGRDLAALADRFRGRGYGPVDREEGRQERIGRNEALFRELNENLVEADAAATLTVVCECGDAGCIDQLVVPGAEYERVRSDPTRFIVRTGHVLADVESVVEEHGRWDVVEKHAGLPAELAEEEDPRS
jgi:hypothetical protein